jgi:pimeloyl-ACP methyl ester carboxylesterase
MHVDNLLPKRARWTVLASALLRTAAAQQPEMPPPGRLLDIGGYRLHLLCSGPPSARPTVVLSAGGGDFAVDWSLVQRPLSDSARVCSYDRAGYGWSDPGPYPRTLRQEASELHAALVAANEARPYVVVGHSIGGLVARLFAEAYRADVAGVVLVGATHESTRLMFRGQFVQLRTLATDRPIPPVHRLADDSPEQLAAAEVDSCRARAMRAARIVRPYDQLRAPAQRQRLWALEHPSCVKSNDDFLAEEMADLFRRRAAAPAPLGDLPLTLVFGTQGLIVPPGVDSAALRRQVDSLRQDYARLSRRSTLIIDPSSGHHVQLDNPSLVVRLIRDMLHASTTAASPDSRR